ncbi:MAG: stalk domain-containing protein, partial [Bacillota bacterium]
MFAFKNNIGLVLLAIFLTSIFPGANAPGEITDLPDEPLAAAAPGSEGVALQWVLPGMPPKGFDSMYAELNEHLAAKTGDTVKFTFLDWGDFESKKSIYYASGETIDLIFSANWFSYEDDVMKGFYYPLDDIIDKLAPKTKKVLGDSVIKAAMVDGELYALPVPGQTSAFSSGLVFRKDLVDKYKIDLSKIKKLEDIEPILSLVKKRQPEIIPLVNCTSKRPFYDLAGLQSMGYDDHIPGALSDDLNDNKVYNEFASPGTMTFFKTLHKFNKAGYLKKYTNQDSGELFCKLMSDANPLLSGYSLGYNWVFVNIGKPTLTKYSATCYMNSIWAHSRYPERAVSMMEFINNDAISSNLLHFGVEGKHYVKISDNVVDYPSGASISKPAYEQYVNWMIGNRYLDFTWKNEDANTYKKLEDFNKTASTSRAIGFEFNNSPVKEESASCKEQVAKYIEGLMNGEYDPAKYLPVLNSALEKAGLNKVLTEKQKQFEAWVADQAALNIKDTSGIKLKLDGEPLTLKYPPVFSNGVPMVPMKQIFDSLDAVYAYDAKAKTVTARKNGNSLKLTLGNSVGSFNGKNIKLAAPPELINGQVYVPLESVCSSLGFEYSWNAAGKTAEITRGFTETNGNTWGNIANCGYVANDDIWQYFSMQDGIYRFKNDGSAITKLSDKPGAFLNAAGGWLYYLDSGAKSTDMHLRLYKMKTDGSLNTLLTPDRAYYANLMGEWIYYINLSDGDKPYRIHIN